MDTVSSKMCLFQCQESVDNGGRGDSTSKPSGQGSRNNAGSNKVARSLTMTLVLLAVGFVAVMRK
ncbi:hypothetical protein DPMN_060498 [Dreissena polymorpha]|uniref:Uncharacterized protein n=1 Tax=Dreissena polymorpha TaxID=45954 RepID=A0A9D4C626_DREPO|nr:hypothetical protein DPMN_060498 [Dreissena polymorpha]